MKVNQLPNFEDFLNSKSTFSLYRNSNVMKAVFISARSLLLLFLLLFRSRHTCPTFNYRGKGLLSASSYEASSWGHPCTSNPFRSCG